MMMVLRHIHVASYMHKASHSITGGTLALNFSPFQCHGSMVTGDIPPPVGIMLWMFDLILLRLCGRPIVIDCTPSIHLPVRPSVPS